MAKCTECEGTGSSVPDCDVCKGTRDVRLKRAYALGWKKVDLSDQGDGYCDCPQCYDTASSCMFCGGDGSAVPEIEDQQRMRVLVCALGKSIPPVFRTNHRGEFIRDNEISLLSRNATAALRDEGLISWYCSFFGDEIYLTEKGEAVAKSAWRDYRALWKKWVTAERYRRAMRATMIAARAALEASPSPKTKMGGSET